MYKAKTKISSLLPEEEAIEELSVYGSCAVTCREDAIIVGRLPKMFIGFVCIVFCHVPRRRHYSC